MGALGEPHGSGRGMWSDAWRDREMAVVAYQDRRKTGSECFGRFSSAIALPVVYADQLHGVLYVETDQNAISLKK